MQDLLFLAHRIPYPPNKGDKVRSWNILRHLASRYRVHLGCFVDNARDRQYEAKLREICADCHFARLDSRVAAIRSVTALVDGSPLSQRYYRDARLAAWVARVIAERRPDRAFIFSSVMAQYVANAGAQDLRRVIDFVDVDSEKWRQYAERRSGPERWLYRREGRRLLAFERETTAHSDAVLFVSAAEAGLFRQLAPESAAKVRHLNNGVDFDFFSPARDYPDPYGPDPNGPDPHGENSRVLVFTGAMDYWPNIDAVNWFARMILPEVRARIPDAAFCIVGGDPMPQVKILAELPGVTVTGRVADVRPYIAHATASVAPLRVARGIQNKVLEAMAMAKTVIATPEAIEGIEAEPEREYLIAADREAFVERICDVFDGGAANGIGARARRRIERDYGWDKSLADLDKILGDDGPKSEIDLNS